MQVEWNQKKKRKENDRSSLSCSCKLKELDFVIAFSFSFQVQLHLVCFAMHLHCPKPCLCRHAYLLHLVCVAMNIYYTLSVSPCISTTPCLCRHASLLSYTFTCFNKESKVCIAFVCVSGGGGGGGGDAPPWFMPTICMSRDPEMSVALRLPSRKDTLDSYMIILNNYAWVTSAAQTPSSLWQFTYTGRATHDCVLSVVSAPCVVYSPVLYCHVALLCIYQ